LIPKRKALCEKGFLVMGQILFCVLLLTSFLYSARRTVQKSKII
jgi:hypothetical protein